MNKKSLLVAALLCATSSMAEVTETNNVYKEYAIQFQQPVKKISLTFTVRVNVDTCNQHSMTVDVQDINDSYEYIAKMRMMSTKRACSGRTTIPQTFVNTVELDRNDDGSTYFTVLTPTTTTSLTATVID